MTVRGAQVRTETFITTNERLASRLEVQDLAYRELSDAASDLREALTTADGTALMNQVQEAFDRTLAAINTKFAGSFVFSGLRTDAVPVNAATLADLQTAVPDVTAVFENADLRQTARIDEETTIDMNRTSSEVIGGLMASFERITDFNASPGWPVRRSDNRCAGRPSCAARSLRLLQPLRRLMTPWVRTAPNRRGSNPACAAIVTEMII